MLSSCLKQETSPVQEQIGNVDEIMMTILEGMLMVSIILLSFYIVKTNFCSPCSTNSLRGKGH